MSTTKRESLRQVQKSYQQAILLHPQGFHLKEIKILAHSLHGQIGGGHVVCLSHSRRQNIQRETKTGDLKEPKFLYCKKLRVRSYLKITCLRIAALFVETIEKLLVRMIDTINPQSN